MWSMNRWCCSSGNVPDPSGTKNSLTSGISRAVTPVAASWATSTTSGSMQSGNRSSTPVRHSHNGRHATSPVARMIQSFSVETYLTTNRSPPMTRRSKWRSTVNRRSSWARGVSLPRAWPRRSAEQHGRRSASVAFPLAVGASHCAAGVSAARPSSRPFQWRRRRPCAASRRGRAATPGRQR